eukprot:6923525-Lingulodinium_polyedra.AAC.1
MTNNTKNTNCGEFRGPKPGQGIAAIGMNVDNFAMRAGASMDAWRQQSSLGETENTHHDQQPSNIM